MRLLPYALFAMSACYVPTRGNSVELPGDWPVSRDIATLAQADEVDALITGYLTEYPLPGVGLALIQGDQVVYSAAYGWSDLETVTELTPDTPMAVASVTKTLAGISAIDATGRGELELADAVSDHAGFAVHNPRHDTTITLQHLLTHNGSVKDGAAYANSYADGDPADDLGEWLQDRFTTDNGDSRKAAFWSFEPGTAFAYSNIGMGLAAHSIAQAAGAETYAALVQDRIFTPLGMANSGLFLADLEATPATLYGSGRGEQWRSYAAYGYPTYPDGAMRTSPNDLGTYLADVLAGFTVLTEEQVDTLLTVDENASTDEDGQAIAWARREMGGRELFGHNGGDFGVIAEVWIDRTDQVGIAIITNGDIQSYDAFIAAFDLESAILDVLAPPEE